MPKGNELFPERLDFFVSKDMRLKIIGIGYLIGAGGRHAAAARKMIELGMKTYLDSLPTKKRAEFDFIMSRVRISEDPKSIHEDEPE
jgi:hypothetical protein